MSAGKRQCRQEHELDMTECAVGAAVVDQVPGMMSNVDMPGESLV